MKNLFPWRHNIAIITNMINKESKKKMVIATAFLATASMAFYAGKHFSKRNVAIENFSNELREGGHNFTNPLLECNPDTYKNNRSVRTIEEKVRTYTDKAVSSGKLDKISVYFRNLNNGPWFAINEDEKFDPASLLKVPIMVAYYKISESDPSLLSKKIKYEGEFDSKDNLSDSEKSLIKGNEYSLEELIYKMVAYSDNKAFSLAHKYMSQNIDKVLLDKISQEMGIFIPMQIGDDAKYSIKDYSSVFRILYNASYLDREMSEKALSILAEGNYDDGLAAPLPKGVKIANKYGVHLSENNGTLQLHDCGIIYHDKTPYLLFIMTKASKEKQNNLVRAIQEISKLVYDDINGNR